MTQEDKQIDRGGAAFPGPSFSQGGHPSGHSMGMTLRDWFAGQALAGIMTGHDDSGSLAWLPSAAAEMAVSTADALIAALGKKP